MDSSRCPYKAATYTTWEGWDAMFRKMRIESGSGSNKSRADEIYVRRVRNITGRIKMFMESGTSGQREIGKGDGARPERWEYTIRTVQYSNDMS